jgi:hypothetical protein
MNQLIYTIPTDELWHLLKAENPDSDDAPITTSASAASHNANNTTTASSITNSSTNGSNGNSNTNTSSSAGAVSTDSRPSYTRADLCEVISLILL